MRRFISIVLFATGCPMLVSASAAAWYDGGLGSGIQLLLVVWFLLLAAIPLALGAWTSPGNRLIELGMALMVGAGASTLYLSTMFVLMNNADIARMMPAGQAMPQVATNPVISAIYILLLAAAGYALWRTGRARERDRDAELEKIFGEG